MKRLPEVGDVVRVGKGKTDQLVIAAFDDTDYDTVRGESWPAFKFVTIPFVVGDSIDPKQKTHLISICRNAESRETKVDLLDVTWVCKAKVKEKITRTFTVK